LKDLEIVIVDDSEAIREVLYRILTKIDGFKVVGMARDGNEGLKVIHALRPDVVILDISMPHKDGIAVLREIRKEDSSMTIIMFTADPSFVLEEVCRQEGANHYVCKTQLSELIDICQGLLETHTCRARLNKSISLDILSTVSLA
jgi:DNA-binding response OmpR family regulator